MRNAFKVFVVISLTLVQACKLPDQIILPAVDAVTVSDVTVFGVKFSSAVRQSGNQDILEYGFVYSETEKAPTIVDDSKLPKGSLNAEAATPVAFDFTLGGLKPNTTYYVRSYASMKLQTVYSEVRPFTTGSVVQAAIRTDDASAVTIRSATLSGTLLGAGTYPITEYGIWWGTGSDPSAGGSKQSVTGDVATFPHTFSFDVVNLTKTTTYNVRAYVISNGVTTFGENKSFQTPDEVPPGIQTGTASDLTINTAKLAATLTTAGTYPVSEYGICWSTVANPTTADSKVVVSGNVSVFPFSYIVSATGLAVSTNYNFRAYVISNGITTYGENQTFKTADVVQPVIRTDGSTDITISSARLSGAITVAGSYAVTEYGICWSISANPTTANAKAIAVGSITSYPFAFSINASSLTAASTYNYRAYVISNGVTTYGLNQTFRTSNVVMPTVVTVGYSWGSTTATANLEGRIDAAGSFPVTEYGVVYSTTVAIPTVSDTKVSRTGNPGVYPFGFILPVSTTPARVYYYRAYAISNGLVTYGVVRNFTTI